MIQYFIDRNLPHKAQKLLTTLESNENYQQLITKQVKIGDNLVLIRINLLKAKLAATSIQKDQFCLNALQEIAKTVNTNQSILITYPQVQAYTCLNRANEIPKIKARLVKLGINNFQL